MGFFKGLFVCWVGLFVGLFAFFHAFGYKRRKEPKYSISFKIVEYVGSMHFVREYLFSLLLFPTVYFPLLDSVPSQSSSAIISQGTF